MGLPHGLTPIACACDRCQAMCERSACIGTPDEARKLIRMGFASRLAAYELSPIEGGFRFIAPAPDGKEGQTLTSTAGRCTFYNDDGCCELHHIGLKPLEGRLAHHTRLQEQIRPIAFATWRGKHYESVMAQWGKAAAM